LVSPSSPAFVITVSGPSGAGKSSTVRAVAEQLATASCFYFDDYGEAMQQPEDGLVWIAAGADLTAFVLPQFGQDLARLRQGETVITPTGRQVEPAPFLVVEEPFGSGRTDMKGLVDFGVCIEVPMEVALARRLLRDAVEKWSGTAEERLQWMGSYLHTYLFEGLQEVYIAINERVKEHSDLILDGTKPLEQNAQKVADAVRALR
jgi:uridine kinase